MTSESLYSGLLVLYPRSFRVRFGREMIQLFRDCYPDARPQEFWLETFKDFAISVPREWQREIRRGDASDIDTTVLLDALMVASITIPLLLGWGWITTAAILRLDASAQEVVLWNAGGGLLIAIATLSMACLVGVLSTMAAARTGRIDTTSCSKLANYEKATARFLR